MPYTFNETLGFILKYGAVGMLLLVAGLCLLLRDLLHAPSSPVAHTEQSLLVLTLLVLLGLSLFSYPSAYPYVCLMAIAIVGAKPSESATVVSANHHQVSLFVNKLLPVFCIVALAILSNRIVGESRWQKAETLSRDGQTARALSLYAFAAQALSDNVELAYNYAAMLNLIADYERSNQELARCTRRLNDYDTEFLAADNALAMNHLAEAERHLRVANRMIPSRFMPLYGLLQVYENRGDAVRLHRVARRILQQPVKIPSPSVDAIKTLARSYINGEDLYFKRR